MASVLIPLAPGCEELEAVTLIDLLRRARIEVVTAGLTDGPVTCSRSTVIIPDTTLDQALQRDFDMIVLPGGQPGASNLERDPRILALLKKMAAANKYIAAICAAPRVLATAGVLVGRRATCYPGTLDGTADIEVRNHAVVTDNRLITSRGPGTAMDFALTLIGLLAGAEVRTSVEAGLVRPPEHALAQPPGWG